MFYNNSIYWTLDICWTFLKFLNCPTPSLYVSNNIIYSLYFTVDYEWDKDYASPIVQVRKPKLKAVQWYT